MSDKERRRELKERYAQTPPSAGAHRIVNTKNDKIFIDSAPNLRTAKSKLQFAKSTKTIGVIYRKMKEGILHYGIEAFEFELLEDPKTEAVTPLTQIRAELKVMEELCRRKVDPALIC